MGAETVLPVNIANGNTGHAGKHNATNAQVNYLTTALAAAGSVDLAEDLGPFAAGKGILLTSPDGTTVVRVSVGNDGEIATEEIVDEGGGGGGGTPDDIAGLLAWFKAADLSALANGDAVNLWADAAGANDLIAGPGTSNAPLYATAGINGHPAVHFVQASDQLMKGPAALASVKPFTYFAVVKATDFDEYGRLLKGNGADIELRLNQTTGYPDLGKAGTAGIGTATSGPTAAVGAVVCCRYDGSGNYSFFINGTAAGSGTADQTFAGASTEAQIGGGLDGYIGEWMIYSAALSPTDRQAVEDYLAAAWGTP